MKTRLLPAALLLSFALFLPCIVIQSAHADLSKVVTLEKAGGFSYRAPMGWEIRDHGFNKYKLASPPLEQGMTFRPMLIFGVLNQKMGFDAFVNSEVRTFEEKKQGKIISKSRFKTDSGLKGYRVIFEMVDKAGNLRMSFYYFPVKQNRQLVVSSISLASDGDTHDADFDECVKSLKAR